MALKLLQRLLGTAPAGVPVGVNAAVSQKSTFVDVRSSRIVSVSFLLQGMTGTPDVTATMQGSNETPPPGANTTNWAPSEASWYTMIDDQGQPLSTSLDVNAVGSTVNLQSSVCSSAWARATSTYVTGTGGTLLADIVAKTSE